MIIKLSQVQMIASISHSLIISIAQNLLAHLLLMRWHLRATSLRLILLQQFLTLILIKISDSTFRWCVDTDLHNFWHFPYKLLHLLKLNILKVFLLVYLKSFKLNLELLLLLDYLLPLDIKLLLMQVFSFLSFRTLTGVGNCYPFLAFLFGL